MLTFKNNVPFCLLLIAFAVLSSGCTDRPRFLVCPSEYASEMRSENRLGQQREILFKAKNYEMLVFEIDADGNHIPVQHYRPEHTFTNREHPETVTWDNPLHISDIVIVDWSQNEFAIAVKKSPDPRWRQYWANKEKIEGRGETGIVYLPPVEELDFIEDAMMKNR